MSFLKGTRYLGSHLVFYFIETIERGCGCPDLPPSYVLNDLG